VAFDSAQARSWHGGQPEAGDQRWLVAKPPRQRVQEGYIGAMVRALANGRLGWVGHNADLIAALRNVGWPWASAQGQPSRRGDAQQRRAGVLLTQCLAYRRVPLGDRLS